MESLPALRNSSPELQNAPFLEKLSPPGWMNRHTRLTSAASLASGLGDLFLERVGLGAVGLAFEGGDDLLA
jgi:hypothetical protein